MLLMCTEMHHILVVYRHLETFMALVQRIAPGTNPLISRVVSKSDSDHGTATTAT